MVRNKIELLINYTYNIRSGILMSADGQLVDFDSLFTVELPPARVDMGIVNVSKVEIV